MNEMPHSNAAGIPSAHELLGAVEMVQALMLKFGGLDLTPKVDGGVEEYVEGAILATAGDEAPLKQLAGAVMDAYEKAAPWKSNSKEKLGDFLGKLVTGQLPLPADTARNYLTVNPVLTGMFANFKHLAVFLQKEEERRKKQTKGVQSKKDAVRLRWRPTSQNWNSPIIMLDTWNSTLRAKRK